MIIIDIEQGSEEWFGIRAGKITASVSDKIITTKGEPSKQAEALIYRLAGERVLGICESSYSSAAMDRGKSMEQEAADYFEFKTEIPLETVGFCYHDEKMIFGGSPDRIIFDESGLEIKCPILSTHVKYMCDNRKLLMDYYQQVQGYMYISDRDYWYLMSYYPGLEDVTIKVERNRDFHSKLDKIISETESRIVEVVGKITGAA